MSAGSKIEWTQATWNPVTGCKPVSPGCLNCFAARDSHRLGKNPHPKIAGKYRELTVMRGGRAVFNGTVRTHDDCLTIPLSWRKPRRIFVNSESDLFHEDVPFEFVDRVWAVMALCPHHTFQVLTKRPERMAEYLASRTAVDDSMRVDRMPQWYQVATAMLDEGAESLPRGAWQRGHDRMPDPTQPLPNVWLGTSVEDQERANERIPHLLRCPAAVRWLSMEPMLGAVDLQVSLAFAIMEGLGGERGLDWVVVGGESGTHVRPMHPDWARSLRDQCQAAGVPFFFKQWGEWEPFYERDRDDPGWRSVPAESQSVMRINLTGEQGFHGERVVYFRRVGKHAAGRMLDGRTWDELPANSGRESTAVSNGNSTGGIERNFLQPWHVGGKP